MSQTRDPATLRSSKFLCWRTAVEALLDARGLAVSTDDRNALDRYEGALAMLHSGRGDALATIEAQLAVMPDFVAGHCLRAAAWVVGGERPQGRALRSAINTLERCADRANPRERRHLGAARAWLAGDPAAALARYGALVADYPLDSLALLVAHTLDFRLGQREALRDRVAQVLPHWDASLPGFSHVLSMAAFGLEETGDYTRAHATALRALAFDRHNAGAMHVVAHVLEMRGRARAGIAWLESMRDVWAANPSYAVHLAWHLALFHVDVDETDAALAIYDQNLAPTAASSMGGLVDASALLWRLALRGRDAHERWRRLAACWHGKRLRGQRAFNLLHAVIAFAGAGEIGVARRTATLMVEDRATRRANVEADLALAIPLADAVLAFAEQDYTRTVEVMKTVRVEMQQCGGSVAQCDLIHLTLVEAALRSERMPLAHALATERTARKPESPLNRWLLERAVVVAAVA